MINLVRNPALPSLSLLCHDADWYLSHEVSGLFDKYQDVLVASPRVASTSLLY
jgi:hypothetical protein